MNEWMNFEFLMTSTPYAAWVNHISQHIFSIQLFVSMPPIKAI